ncbi:MAG: hypothetical protein V1674_00345 [Candidatus Omnitrophota bacterium]
MSKHRLRRLKTQITQIFVIFTACSLMCSSLTGCDAMRKKFIRTKKSESLETPIYVPVEYNQEDKSKERIYRDYFAYWQSWQDELINNLDAGANHKKQIECVDQIILNLEKMKLLLADEKQKRLDAFILQSKKFKEDIARPNLSIMLFSQLKSDLARQKRAIIQQFNYPEIKDFMR